MLSKILPRDIYRFLSKNISSNAIGRNSLTDLSISRQNRCMCTRYIRAGISTGTLLLSRNYSQKTINFKTFARFATSDTSNNDIETTSGVAECEEGSDTSESQSPNLDNLNETQTKAYEEIQMHLYLERQVPEDISLVELDEYISTETVSGRLRYLRFLYKKEKTRKSQQRKKEERRKVREAELEKIPVELRGTSNKIMLMFWDTSETNFYDWNAARGMRFGQRVCYDMSFQHLMKKRDLINLGQQLQNVYGSNRRDHESFHLTFCNLEPDGAIDSQLKRAFATAYDRIMVDMTEKSYLDLYPKEDIIYLTADSPNDMKKLDPDKVYIIGALVDKPPQKNITLADAKRYGLRTERLPLDRYLEWEQGSKELTLDQVTRILLTFQSTQDWDAAFDHVPKRKVRARLVDVAEQRLREMDRGGKKRKHRYQNRDFSDSKSRFQKSQKNPIKNDNVPWYLENDI